MFAVVPPEVPRLEQSSVRLFLVHEQLTCGSFQIHAKCECVRPRTHDFWSPLQNSRTHIQSRIGHAIRITDIEKRNLVTDSETERCTSNLYELSPAQMSIVIDLSC